MPVSYLVDGYNLLFALGLLDRRDGVKALLQARCRLLERLRTALADGETTVVFDSGRHRTKAPVVQEYEGLHIRFAHGGEVADDVIETLIVRNPSPGNLVVISNDQRIQAAARRRGARSWSSDQFLDHAEASPKTPRPARPDRPPLSRDDVQHWLEEFADLADDPAFREVFESFPFGDVDEQADNHG
jgi:predicted RNA-binding protein with PIN domain